MTTVVVKLKEFVDAFKIAKHLEENVVGLDNMEINNNQLSFNLIQVDGDWIEDRINAYIEEYVSEINIVIK